MANISSLFVGGSLFKTAKEASVARFEENTVAAFKAPTRIDIIHEPEMIQMVLAVPTEWKGQFKLIKELTQISGNAGLSKLYSKEVLFKDPKSGQMFRVLQRNDIDPNKIVGTNRKAGMPETNLDRMLDGKAPITNSGEKVNLHHIGQDVRGPIVEVAEGVHQLHPHELFGRNNPHPTYPVIRSEFNKTRKAYWRARAEQFK